MTSPHFRFARALSRCLPAALLLLAPGAGAADLWDIYQVALARDAAYHAARYQYESEQLNVPLARSALLPAVSASGSGGSVRDETNGVADTMRDNQLTLSAAMPLFDRALSLEVNRARLQAANAKIRFDQAQDALIVRVSERYFEMLAARDAKAVARAAVLAIGRQRDLATQRLEVGLGTRTDLFDAEARYQQAVVDEIRADNAIHNAAHALKKIIGYTPGSLTPLSEDAPLATPSPHSAEAWVKAALADNLALQAADFDVKIAVAEIKKVHAAAWPKITAEISAQQIDAVGEMGRDESSSFKATLNWPLFQSGALRSKTKQSALLHNAALQTREDTRRRVESDAASAYLTAASNLSQVKALSEAVRAGASALQAKEEGFRAGLTTNIDVLDAQRDQSGTRTEHLRARYDFILSLLRLEQAAGGLDEHDLQRINRWLRPAAD
ncbi:MAG: TolC family outer membrane protein [Gammaproteobacteria bacterium]